MSESFLARWSRRKRADTSPRLRGEVDARSASGEGDDKQTELTKAPPTPDPSPPRASRAGGGEPQGPSSPQEAEFDPASLPPIESINAGTDVSAFLRPGVPADVAQAALRRAWVADPAIRDFVGLAENAWDFNKPGGVPGFEPLRAIDDVQRLAAQVAGVMPTAPQCDEKPKDVAEPTQSASQSAAATPPDEAAPSPDDAAAQKEASSAEERPLRPRHGGALAE